MPTKRKSEESSSTGSRKRRSANQETSVKPALAKTKRAAVSKEKTTSRATRSGGKATARSTAPRTRKVQTAPVSELAAQTMRDYKEAKKVLGTLWQDVAKTTHTAFSSVADKVEKRFQDSRKAISEIDVRYALEKSQAKLKDVGKGTSAVGQAIVNQTKLLYQMLKDASSGRFKAPWATVSAITAALLYFVSPIDILPDFIPGAGLIDDALVISLCISVIRLDLKRYAREMNLKLEDYGLSSK